MRLEKHAAIPLEHRSVTAHDAEQVEALRHADPCVARNEPRREVAAAMRDVSSTRQTAHGGEGDPLQGAPKWAQQTVPVSEGPQRPDDRRADLDWVTERRQGLDQAKATAG